MRAESECHRELKEGRKERSALLIPETMSTLRIPQPVPPVADDCEQLRKAFAGWGTNEDLIISILGHRNAAQRKLIRETYFETYGEDLLKALDKELSNDFERLVLLWTLDPAERDAFLANEATKRWTSSNQVLMEIACTRSSDQLLFARKAYHARYKKSLEEDVAHHTTGEFRKVLLLVLDHNYEYVVKHCTYINVKRVVLIWIS
ncbi:hypothetical protein Ahy_A07g036384 isoform C [Arachis hypogaea]|uniref:Annexin n=1 Tax=Arachis hypogaea TaxID=3818 RepID=A0A445CG22_ARAHY|nr:hypothetical protein Ahy_A07g036384 isoform C [Arachis hypogaea]